MNYLRQTNVELLNHLLKLSKEKTTNLTIAEVRELLNVPETVGPKTLNLIVPELKFTACVYKGKSYLKIQPDYAKIDLKVDRKGAKDEN